MQKYRKILKILFLVLLGMVCIYCTWLWGSTILLVIKNNWLATTIFTTFDLIYGIVTILSVYFLWILCFLYLFYKGKVKRNNDLLQGFRFLCLIISFLITGYFIYLVGYDLISLFKRSGEHILYGETIYLGGLAIIFDYMTFNLKEVLLNNKKVNEKILILGIVLLLGGSVLNNYLIKKY